MNVALIPKFIANYVKRRKLTSGMMLLYTLLLLLLSLLFRTDPTFKHHSDVLDILLIMLVILIALIYFGTLILMVYKNSGDREKVKDYEIAICVLISLTIFFFYLIPF